MDSGQKNSVIKILSPAVDGEDEHPPTNIQEKVKNMKVGSPSEHAASLESLMQEQAADMTAVTVDEVALNHPPQHHPSTTLMQEQLPIPPPHLLPAQPTQLAPLQLVYLQPTPHGVNIIPIQASGQPSFTPCSPLGFPAHPHHPVVVQPGLPFPLHQPTFYTSHPAYPQYNLGHPPHYQGQVLPHPAGAGAPIFYHNTSAVSSIPSNRQQFFRPWEDAVHPHTSDQSVLCPHTDCGGEGGQHSQAGPQVPPYSEEDFPELTKELSKIKIKK